MGWRRCAPKDAGFGRPVVTAAGVEAQHRVRGARALTGSGGGDAILNGFLPRRRQRGVAAGRCPPPVTATLRGCGEKAPGWAAAGQPGAGRGRRLRRRVCRAAVVDSLTPGCRAGLAVPTGRSAKGKAIKCTSASEPAVQSFCRSAAVRSGGAAGSMGPAGVGWAAAVLGGTMASAPGPPRCCCPRLALPERAVCAGRRRLPVAWSQARSGVGENGWK